MTHTPHIHAMIVAAGQGSRFGASIAKQYVMLGKQTLLQHTVAALATSHYIDSCLLVIAKDDNTAQTLSFALPVWYTYGGAERWQSVRAGIDAIIARGAKADDLVLIHDAARPAVPSEDIERVISAAKQEAYGAILATPVADTLKQAKRQQQPKLDTGSVNDYAVHTIDRTNIWQAQTPQVFRVKQLCNVLDQVKAQSLSITDEASAFEYLQYPIRLVVGSRQNIKLTYPSDEQLLNALLKINGL